MKIETQFTEEQLLIIFEAARIALGDADIFDNLAEQMDISDDVMKKAHETLLEYLGKFD